MWVVARPIHMWVVVRPTGPKWVAARPTSRPKTTLSRLRAASVFSKGLTHDPMDYMPEDEEIGEFGDTPDVGRGAPHRTQVGRGAPHPAIQLKVFQSNGLRSKYAY